MKTLKLAALAATMIFGSALADEASQEVEREMKVQVIVSGDGPSDGTTINWTSSDPNLNLHNMQVGESQSIVDDSGRSILVTKQEDGLKFDVDGESIVIPDMGDMHGANMAFVSADGMDGVEHDFDVRVIGGGGHAMASPVSEGVMIITDEPLDATTRESIRLALQSAGNDDEVTFIDSSGDGSGRHIKVMRKHVEITN